MMSKGLLFSGHSVFRFGGLSINKLLNYASFRNFVETELTNVVKNCMLAFSCPKAEDVRVILKRKRKLFLKYASLNNKFNLLCVS